MNTEKPMIGVFGLGNVLMSDDAFGPYSIETLKSLYTFPEHVSVRDLGTPSLELITYIDELDFLIVLDAVHSDGKPGEIRTYRKEQLLAHAVQPRVSPHEPALKEALLTAELIGRGPREVFLVGVIPEKVTVGCELSLSVRNSIPAAVYEVVNELRILGVEPTKMNETQPSRIWWEESYSASVSR